MSLIAQINYICSENDERSKTLRSGDIIHKHGAGISNNLHLIQRMKDWPIS